MAEDKTPPADAPASLDWRWCVAVALLALVAHFGVLSAGLVYDDDVLVGRNTWLRDAGNVGSLASTYEDRLDRGYFESDELSWRPVATALHLVEFAAFGINADAPPDAAFKSSTALHAVSWLLHAGVAVLCFAFLFAVGLPRHAAFLGAALFAVHPVQVEAVVMVSFREDLLATGFALGACWLAALGPPKWGRAAAIAALTFLACGSKESALVLPVLLAIVAWVHHRSLSVAPDSAAAPDEESAKPAAWWKAWIPAGALTAAATGLFVILRFAVFTHPGEGELEPVRDGIFGLIAADLWIVSEYAFLLGLPTTLLIDRVVPATLPWFGVLLGLLLVAGFAASAWKSRVALPRATAAIAFIAVALLPVMNLVPVSIPLSERFLYLPMIGVVWLVAEFFSVKVPRMDHPNLKPWAVAVGVLCLIYIVRDHRRAGDFSDNPTLWAATYAANPNSARACANHGLQEFERARVLLNQNRLTELPLVLDGAVALHERAVELDPGEFNNRMKLASSLAMRSHVRTNTGDAAGSARDMTEALAQMQRVIEQEPDYAEAHTRFGDLLQQRGGPGDLEAALERYRKSMELEPHQLEPRRLYATQLTLAGKKREGLAVIQAAPEAQRNHAYWYATLAWIQKQLGDRAGELKTLEQGLDAFPQDPHLRKAHMDATSPANRAR